ncbi:DNA polymerase III alpha subunit [Oxalobacteraceae bacterium GrIS 1.11]
MALRLRRNWSPAHVKRAGLPLIIGAHFHLQNGDGSPVLSLLALAQNRNGYGNLSELITLALLRA